MQQLSLPTGNRCPQNTKYLIQSRVVLVQKSLTHFFFSLFCLYVVRPQMTLTVILQTAKYISQEQASVLLIQFLTALFLQCFDMSVPCCALLLQFASAINAVWLRGSFATIHQHKCIHHFFVLRRYQRKTKDVSTYRMDFK